MTPYQATLKGPKLKIMGSIPKGFTSFISLDCNPNNYKDKSEGSEVSSSAITTSPGIIRDNAKIGLTIKELVPAVSNKSTKTNVSKMEREGLHVESVCFEGSGHVSHFHRHPVQYITALQTFLANIGLLQDVDAKAGMKVSN